MVMAPEDVGVETHPVIYAGRYADSLAGVDLPEDCAVLDDWEVLPLQLAPVMERAATLVVLDVFSFPFDAMTREQWDVPLVLVVPDGFDAAFLEAAFGIPLFEQLGFFDHLVVRDDDLWKRLRPRYGWAENRRIEVEGEGLGAVVSEVLARLEAEFSVPTFFGGDEYEALPYWKERGEALAASAPHRAICSVHHGPRFNKAMHRAQAAVLEPQFMAARGDRDESNPFEVLEVGAGVGRWAQSFGFSNTSFAGVDISAGMVEAARANFPEGRFEHLGDDMVFPYDDESFDLVFSVTVLHHNPTPAKLALISEMWRVARPGGRLLFLEDFVSGGWMEKSTVYPMSVTKFVDVLLGGDERAGVAGARRVPALPARRGSPGRGARRIEDRGAERVVGEAVGAGRRVFVISNDIVPSLGMPVAAPGLRAFGLAEGLRANGVKTTTIILRGSADGQWLRFGKSVPHPTAPDTEVVSPKKLVRYLEAHAPATVVLINSNQIDHVKPIEGIRYVLDFFAPKMLEMLYQHGEGYPGEELSRLRQRKIRAIQLADAFIVNGKKKVPYFLAWTLQADRDIRHLPLEVVNMGVPLSTPKRSVSTKITSGSRWPVTSRRGARSVAGWRCWSASWRGPA